MEFKFCEHTSGVSESATTVNNIQQRIRQGCMLRKQDHGAEEARQDTGLKGKGAGKESWLWPLTRPLHGTLFKTVMFNTDGQPHSF